MVDVNVSGNDAGPLNDEDIQKTKTRYIGLEYMLKNGAGQWAGHLILNHIHNHYTINDSFEILIEIPKEYPVSFPRVKEIGGRTEKIAKKYKDQISSVLDLHVFPEGMYACLGAPNELRDKFPQSSSFDQYIENLVVPYFYGLSYFEKNGSWPWGERSHGYLGLLEAYGDRRVETSKEEIIRLLRMLRKIPEWKDVAYYLSKVKNRRLCLCSKKSKSFADCHSLAWNGIKQLQSDVAKNKINIYQC